ncbi:MAG: ImmA/IrrE family metallo-endopeptidase [Planktothrix sp.]|uniref:ImmA/IrrE family metallo-endopeptidase n=1 Tax=Planktothrix sp. TaxID=3088171 RepID=UPI0038D38BC2
MSVLKPYRFYRRESIERRALEILRQMQTTPNFSPEWPFEASLVADFLDLGVVWDCIPPDEQGAIAARILPTERLIEINEEIQEKPKGFIESTIAHEIGHWVLHINHDQLESGALKSSDNRFDEPFVCRGATEESHKASIEWQAQYFASCLLMPRHVLEEKRQGRDLTQWRHLYKIKDELGVSISNLTNRLQELGWISIPKGERTIYPGKAA